MPSGLPRLKSAMLMMHIHCCIIACYFMHYILFSHCTVASVQIIIVTLHLHTGNLADAFIQNDLHLSEERETIYLCRYSKDVHRTKCQALTTPSLTRSPYTTQIARIRCYTKMTPLIVSQSFPAKTRLQPRRRSSNRLLSDSSLSSGETETRPPERTRVSADDRGECR